MADTKISAFTTDATPHRSNDFAPTYDASAVTTKKVALKNFGVIELWAGFSNSSPADATTYYFGSFPGTALQTTAGARRIYVHRTGIFTRAFVLVVNTGTAGTAETSTLSLRLNNTSDTTILSNLTTNGSGLVFASSASFTTSVAADDFVEVKWVTPSWATNPTGVYINVQLLLE